MNIAEYSIKNRVISWMFLIILLVGGSIAFLDLGRLEDPSFTIKDAKIVATYPGATATEVEEELTYPIEKQLKQLSYVKEVNSISSEGLAQITVKMKDKYSSNDLKLIWQEMRSKISDLQPMLPSGVNSLGIYDDFGDVYGILLMLTGEDYDYVELKRYADHLTRELDLVEGVGKVTMAGNQQEQLFVEVSIERLAALNLDLNSVQALLATQNSVVSSGNIMINGSKLSIYPSGSLDSIEHLENLIIQGKDTGNLIRLKDVATISRGIQEVPMQILTFNGKPAISLGVSFASGVNVVEIGERIETRLTELENIKPAGMQIDYFYNQPVEVDESVKAFVITLAEAVGIVILVLLFTMGIKSGIIIGLVLLLTVLGTFILMLITDIELHRISLGALIIALGMLVDNAIVVVEGILIGIKRGKSKLQAAKDIVSQTQWPLLGATVIAIIAFAPIGLSSDATGEFMASLFWVLCYSLFLSWITALTLTPFLSNLLLKDEPNSDEDNEDPYKGFVFVIFGGLLKLALRFRLLTAGAMIALLIASIFAFGSIKQAFFPPSNTPMFYVDIWMPEGTDIRETAKLTAEVEAFIGKKEGIDYIATTVGQGMPRFMLTYDPESGYAAYSQLLVRTTKKENIIPLIKQLETELPARYTAPMFRLRILEFGPNPPSKIEARISGADPQTLRDIGRQIEDILLADNGSRNVRHSWRDRTKTLTPQFNESKARRLGITKEDLANTLQTAFGGQAIGIFRDGTQMIPIVSRLPDKERVDFETMQNLTVWSPTLQNYVPIEQVIDGVKLEWTEPLIMRRDRKRTLTVMADHDILGDETPASLFNRIRPQVEALQFPDGYDIEWGGEYESSNDAQKAMFVSLPLGYLAMFLITVFLFNTIMNPLVIWFTVPMAIIGVSFGLLASNMPFSFAALLGLISLTGMILKNGIVLMDQINLEMATGKEPYQAVYDSAISRVRPVGNAAATTILGMIPLLFDPFFASMAVAIMAGLGFATILTLIIVPVMYALLHRIKPE